MKSILIRNVDPVSLDKLKRLARSHRRSLQGEIHAILDTAVRRVPDESADELDLVVSRTGRQSTWTREEIYGDGGR